MTYEGLPGERRRVVLYDGLCGLCDGFVQFLLRHDKKDAFRYAPQQSEFARNILARHGLGDGSVETICLIEDCNLPTERVLTKSDATLRIAESLGGIWSLALVAKVLPRLVRDALYDFVASNRFRIFGKRSQCRVPTAQDRHKFVG